MIEGSFPTALLKSSLILLGSGTDRSASWECFDLYVFCCSDLPIP
jgi:hypothetical protein